MHQTSDARKFVFDAVPLARTRCGRIGPGRANSDNLGLVEAFSLCSNLLVMNRIAHTIPPIPDCQLTGSIAAWVQNAPRHVLLELADSAARADAARKLGEIIVVELTMSYPELVDSSAPPLPFPV